MNESTFVGFPFCLGLTMGLKFYCPGCSHGQLRGQALPSTTHLDSYLSPGVSLPGSVTGACQADPGSVRQYDSQFTNVLRTPPSTQSCQWSWGCAYANQGVLAHAVPPS